MISNVALPLIFCLFFTLPAVANQHYQNNIHYAKDASSLRPNTNFNARDYCKAGDTACVRGIAHPKEQHLTAHELKQKALVQKESDEMGSAVSTAFIHQPDIDLNSSQDLQRAVQVMDNSYEITHGIANRYTDCATPNQSCQSQSIEKTCRKSAGVNTCDALSDCELLTQTCVEQDHGFCLTHEQKRRCIVRQCQPNQMICGEQSFCLDGECDTDAKERDQAEQTEDFQKNASSLAAMNSAGKSLKDASLKPTMFQGKGMKCGGDVIAFTKCCQDSGWGLGLGISECSEEEKKLGQAKEQGLAVYLGKYCSTRVLGICLKRKKGYCVFDNKMAYIIQTQGRRGQLNISMGTGKHPNCRGITPKEMQGLDFSKVDFSSFYSELNHKTPDPHMLQRKMAQKLRQKI